MYHPGSLGTAGGGVAVRSAREAEKPALGDYCVLISRLPLPHPLEYLNLMTGASLGVHPHILQPCYQMNLM